MYFLVIGCLQLDVFFPGLSPTHWSTTIGPLLFVLSINAVKEAVDDYGRHKSDAEVNARTVEVVRVKEESPDGKKRVVLESTAWRDLRVGDVAKVRADAEIPADLLLVASADVSSLAYVETANLDGETNLKVKTTAPIEGAREALRELDNADALVSVFTQKNARLACEAPNNQLYKFEGKWITGGEEGGDGNSSETETETGLSADNVLLRGSTLRNAKFVFGVVVFTGGDTKLMRNATRAPRKTSRLERHMNVLVMCVGLFQTLVGLALAGAQREWLWRQNPEVAAGGSNGDQMRHWYLAPSGVWPDVEAADADGFFTQFVRFVVLLNALIPISLYVTLELVKVIQCFLISNDKQLYDKENDTKCGVRTTTLNEELGAVSCVLSDKTGTLTRNVMAFAKCSINGIAYGEDDQVVNDVSCLKGFSNEADFDTLDASSGASHVRVRVDAFVSGDDETNATKTKTKTKKNDRVAAETHVVARSRALRAAVEARHPPVAAFLEHLATCHTVVPEPLPPSEEESEETTPSSHGAASFGGFKYQASSPDEEALVTGAAILGRRVARNADGIVEILSSEEDVEEKTCTTVRILAVNEFTSARKRMSVIVRDDSRAPGERLILRLKGADATVLERCAEPADHESRMVLEKTKEHLDLFAREGLRTLVLAERVLSESEFEDWIKTYEQASASIVNREDALAACAENIERDCFVIGATAVEDKLQEGVPETIETLRNAGLLVWMLTGDKLETAVSIAHTCRLIDKDGDLVVVREEDFVNDAGEGAFLKKKAFEAREDASLGSSFGLVIEGGALAHALLDKHVNDFLDLCDACVGGVVCCRVSPIQKAAVCEAMKRREARVVLGIGDGANDVGLITAAHVGVGISGREGRAAVMAADYSVGTFRGLSRLMLVHGRLSAKRNEEVVLYAFYKNFAYAMANVWFAFGSAFSAQPAFPTAAIATFNVLWTSFPTIAHAVFDQDVRVDSVFKVPALYRETSSKSASVGFDFAKRVGWWSVSSAFASGWCFACAFLTLASVGTVDERTGVVTLNHMTVGLATFTAVVLACDFKIATRTNHWTIANVVAVVFSAAAWFPFLVATSKAWFLVGAFADVSDASDALFVDPRFWLAVVLGSGTAALADLATQCFVRVGSPSLAEVVREREAIDAADAKKRDGGVVTKKYRNALASRLATFSARAASLGYSLGKSFGARSFASTERGALPVTARDGGAWKGACARRKSRNPSVLEVVKQHRNFSDDWNP